MSVTQKQVQILGTSIRENSDGLLCLNDLFHASGSKPKDAPNQFFKLARTKEVVKILAETDVVRVIYKKYTSEGLITYVNRHLFLHYAGHISAKVEMAAYSSLLSDMIKSKEEALKIEANNSILEENVEEIVYGRTENIMKRSEQLRHWVSLGWLTMSRRRVWSYNYKITFEGLKFLKKIKSSFFLK